MSGARYKRSTLHSVVLVVCLLLACSAVPFLMVHRQKKTAAPFVPVKDFPVRYALWSGEESMSVALKAGGGTEEQYFFDERPGTKTHGELCRVVQWNNPKVLSTKEALVVFDQVEKELTRYFGREEFEKIVSGKRIEFDELVGMKVGSAEMTEFSRRLSTQKFFEAVEVYRIRHGVEHKP